MMGFSPVFLFAVLKTVVFLVVLIYLLVLVTRLVGAVERIADHFEGR